MNNTLFALILIILCFITGVDSCRKNISKSMPEIGDIFPKNLSLDSNNSVQIYLSAFESVPLVLYSTEIDDIIYYYALENTEVNRKVVSMILVKDNKFRTPENLKVGDPIIEALKLSGFKITSLPTSDKGFIALKSGWKAGFMDIDLSLPCTKSIDISDTANISGRKIEYFIREDFDNWDDHCQDSTSTR